MIFAIPRGRITYVGTTDTDYYGNLERVVTTKADVNYLLNAVNAVFPEVNLSEKDIESNWAGLRPLIHEDEKDPSELSRKDEIFISKSGLISIAGGKLTGYRKMAHRVIDAVIDTLSIKQSLKFKDSFTEKITLTTHVLASSDEVKKYQKKLQLLLKKNKIDDPYFAWYLTSTYGKQSEIIINQMPSFSNKNAELRLIRAELWYGVHHEMINNLADFFVRRTGRLYFNISSIPKFKSAIIKDCIQYLDWDQARVKTETDLIDMLLKDATHFYEEELK
jgi:glycerol-3-phosphate dehydrogenase